MMGLHLAWLCVCAGLLAWGLTHRTRGRSLQTRVRNLGGLLELLRERVSEARSQERRARTERETALLERDAARTEVERLRAWIAAPRRWSTVRKIEASAGPDVVFETEGEVTVVRLGPYWVRIHPTEFAGVRAEDGQLVPAAEAAKAPATGPSAPCPEAPAGIG